MPWTSGYATNVGQLEIYFDLSTSSGYVVDFFTFRGIFYTILYVAMFVLLRGWRSLSPDRPRLILGSGRLSLSSSASSL